MEEVAESARFSTGLRTDGFSFGDLKQGCFPDVQPGNLPLVAEDLSCLL
jgi:hypothetical protein